MGRSAYSARRLRESALRAPLVAAYGAWKAVPAKPESDETNTTWPRPRSSMPPTARRVSSRGATRLTATTASSSSAVSCSNAAQASTAALWTSMSSGPTAASARSISVSAARGSPRSAGMGAGSCAPAARRSAARSASTSSRRPEMASRTPFEATARATAGPNPPVAPVGSAVPPSRSVIDARVIMA
jgi:hypothetical protein